MAYGPKMWLNGIKHLNICPNLVRININSAINPIATSKGQGLFIQKGYRANAYGIFKNWSYINCFEWLFLWFLPTRKQNKNN